MYAYYIYIYAIEGLKGAARSSKRAVTYLPGAQVRSSPLLEVHMSGGGVFHASGGPLDGPKALQ